MSKIKKGRTRRRVATLVSLMTMKELAVKLNYKASPFHGIPIWTVNGAPLGRTVLLLFIFWQLLATGSSFLTCPHFFCGYDLNSDLATKVTYKHEGKSLGGLRHLSIWFLSAISLSILVKSGYMISHYRQNLVVVPDQIATLIKILNKIALRNQMLRCRRPLREFPLLSNAHFVSYK